MTVELIVEIECDRAHYKPYKSLENSDRAIAYSSIDCITTTGLDG
ncbi:MAG: hypothetical protein ACRCZS_20840 [Chroococcidiopsis sp.]